MTALRTIRRHIEMPTKRVQTPIGPVTIEISEPGLFQVTLDAYTKINRCIVTGAFAFRKNYTHEWKVNSRSLKNRGPTGHGWRRLTSKQYDVVFRLEAWLIQWAERNAIIFELVREVHEAAEYWEELTKDDPNGRSW